MTNECFQQETGGVSLRDRLLGGLVGLVVGDALGVPAEFKSREALRHAPVRGMTG